MTFESFTSHSLTFHLEDGSTHEVCGFSAEPVIIEMLPNQVAEAASKDETSVA
jgi:hypothetical protein